MATGIHHLSIRHLKAIPRRQINQNCLRLCILAKGLRFCTLTKGLSAKATGRMVYGSANSPLIFRPTPISITPQDVTNDLPRFVKQLNDPHPACSIVSNDE